MERDIIGIKLVILEIKSPFSLACQVVRGVIVFPSTYTWHWHPTKQMKGLRTNGTFGNMINYGALSLISSIQNMCMFIGALAIRDENRVDVKGWTTAEPSQLF